MAKYATLARLEDGWDGPESLSPRPHVMSAYRQFMELVPPRLLPDAEPMAMADGGLQLEWDRGDWSYIAEIEPTGHLYVCALGPEEFQDEDRTIPGYDLDALLDFLVTGRL